MTLLISNLLENIELDISDLRLLLVSKDIDELKIPIINTRILCLQQVKEDILGLTKKHEGNL